MAKPHWKKSTVSLSLTDYYCASIAPGSATLLLMRHGWRPAVVQKTMARTETRADASPWLAELGLLEGLLGEARRGAPLSITLSNHYLRYRLVPAPPPSMTDTGVQSLIRHCFRETYGDAADGWKIQANPMPGRGDLVACAVDRALMEGLQAAAGKSGLKLVSAQPYFMNGFNAAHRNIGGAATCFVQVEAGRIVMGTMRGKKWLGLRAVTATPRWKEELPAHIQREILLAGWGDTAPDIFLHAPESGQSIDLENMRHWKINLVMTGRIAGHSPKDDSHYALALSGVR